MPMSAAPRPSSGVRPANQLATLSIVLGLTSIAIVFWRWIPIIGIVFSVAAIVVAIPAVVTGHVARQRSRELQGEGRGLALAGMVCGYFTIGFAIIMPVASLGLFLVGAVGFASDNVPEWLAELERLLVELTQ